MSDATFAAADLTTFARLDELGLEVVGQRLEPDRAVLACRVVEPDGWCRRCGCEGAPRDTVTRRLAHEPFGWRPTVLEVTVRRYRCTGCSHVWRQDTHLAAEPRAKLSRRALTWALEGASTPPPCSTRQRLDEHRRFNGIIELHRRIARGYRNPDNYRPRMLLVAGGLLLPPDLR